MDPRLFTAVIVVVGVPAALVGYIYATELGLRLAPATWRDRIRPWFWLAPAPRASSCPVSRSMSTKRLSFGPVTLVCATVLPPGMASSVALMTR